MNGINFFIHDLNAFGGQDRSTLEILAELSREIPVHVYACSFDGSSRPDHRIHFHRCPLALRRPVLLKSVLFQLWSAWILATGPRRLSISTGTASLFSDIVHVQFVANAWKEEKRKLVSQKKPLMRAYHRLLSFYNEGAEKIFFTRRRTYVAIAHTVAEQLRRHFDAQNVEVVHHGVDTEKFAPAASVAEKSALREKLGLPSDKFLFLLVGAYERKGLATLVRAARGLRGEFPECAVVAVGAGDHAIYRELAGAGSEHWLHLVPPSRTIEEFYRAADAFVLPTLYEPFGLVILEAMAAGLPAIVSRGAGAAELVTDGMSGWLLQNPADPAELAAAIRQLLEAPADFAQMGAAARAVAEGHRWNKVADKFLRIIRERERYKTSTLIVTYDYPPKRGGIATYSAELAHALHQYGPVAVVAPLTNKPELLAPFPIRRFSVRGGPLRSFLAMFRQIQGHLKKNPSSRVFCTNWYPAGLATYLSPRRWWQGNPYFVAAHGAELLDKNNSWRSTPRKWLRRLVLRRAEAVFSVSHFTASRVSKCMGRSRRASFVIPNGVNTEDFYPVLSADEPGPFRIFSVCRLEPHKGIDTALAACAELKKRGLPFVYRIAGTGPDFLRLRQLTEQYGITDEVEFLGDVKDLRAYYQSCDVFLLLSREIPGAAAVEGFGLVFLEAAACGKTAVGTWCGGIPDAVIDGETGLLVAPEDVMGAAAALEKLYRDPAGRERLARAATARAIEDLSWSHVARRLSTAMTEATRA